MVDVICLNPECIYCEKSRCTRECITISEKLWCEQYIKKEDIKKEDIKKIFTDGKEAETIEN